MDVFGNDDSEFKAIYREAKYCLQVKKGYVIGDIGVFDGELLKLKHGKE